jgi:hypothetical protein
MASLLSVAPTRTSAGFTSVPPAGGSSRSTSDAYFEPWEPHVVPDFVEEIRRVTRDLATIARKLEDLIAEVDRLGRRVERLGDTPRTWTGPAGGAPSGHPPYATRGARDPRTRALLAEAKGGAHAFSMDWCPDGSAMVSVNNGEAFHLAPLLAALLAILASKTGDDGGPLVGWKTRKEVLIRLAKEFGRKRQPRALNQLVYRLRNELEARGVNRYLLQTKARAGLRFALQLAAIADLEGGGRGC